MSPVKFIPIAEETGLIVPIGDWVLHDRLPQNKAWQDAGLPPMTVCGERFGAAVRGQRLGWRASPHALARKRPRGRNISNSN